MHVHTFESRHIRIGLHAYIFELKDVTIIIWRPKFTIMNWPVLM